MFTNPQKNVEIFGLVSGMQVADLGAGSGFYSLAAAKLVGENGKIYAVDVQKELLSKLKKEAEEKDINNIEIVWGNVEEANGTRLADSSMDAVIASNILFQMADKSVFIKEIWRILKPQKGKAYIIDWADSFGGLGPQPESVVNAKTAKEIFSKQGFELERELSNVGMHHYGLIFKKNKE